MKTFLLIFIFALSLNAESIYNSKCVKDFNVYKSGTISNISLTYSDNTTQLVAYSDSLLSFLIAGLDKFEQSTYKAGMSNVVSCKSITKNNTQILISSLTGILIGFTILFFSIFLTIKVGSRND